jgi:hypothetical protein
MEPVLAEGRSLTNPKRGVLTDPRTPSGIPGEKRTARTGTCLLERGMDHVGCSRGRLRPGEPRNVATAQNPNTPVSGIEWIAVKAIEPHHTPQSTEPSAGFGPPMGSRQLNGRANFFEATDHREAIGRPGS